MAGEEKSFWHDVGVGVTTSIILAALTAIAALIWKFAPTAWEAIIRFLVEPRFLPTWAFIFLGMAFLGVMVWARFEKGAKEYERVRDLPLELAALIQSKGMWNDLLKGNIRYRDGKVLYGDILRRKTPVPEFENWKPTPKEEWKMPSVRVRKKWWIVPPWGD